MKEDLDATKEQKILTFKCGGWEEGEFELHFDEEICLTYGHRSCKHCSESFVKVTTRFDKTTFETEHCICARMIVAYNEGGNNTTGICLDCLLEADLPHE